MKKEAGAVRGKQNERVMKNEAGAVRCRTGEEWTRIDAMKCLRRDALDTQWKV